MRTVRSAGLIALIVIAQDAEEEKFLCSLERQPQKEGKMSTFGQDLFLFRSRTGICQAQQKECH